MTTEPCPECKGRCCMDECGYRIEHMAAEFYEHVCELCVDGDKYVPPRTYEDGIAEGERRATAAVVAWLRATPPRMSMWIAMLDAADDIERGEHRREEK